jgi:nickel superoxide dismutase
MKKNNKATMLLLTAFMLFAGYNIASAHCEIPCGIYEDSLRIASIKEDIRTIEKSMNKINELSKADKINYNQLVRWINNKEKHAEKIQQIAWQYFLTQRIKLKDRTPAEQSKYYKQLEALHKITVFAMKCKQTTDLTYTQKLLESVDEFVELYFHKHKH